MLVSLLASTGNPDGGVSAEDKARFTALLLEGEAAFADGGYLEAAQTFRTADALISTPEVAFNLAKCHEKLQRSALETYFYRLYLRRAPRADDALEVKRRVQSLLESGAGEGRGLLELEAEPGERPLSAVVSGEPQATLPTALFVAPGDYEVQVAFESGVSRQLASVRTGEVSRVLALAPKQVAAGPLTVEPSKEAAPLPALAVARGSPASSALHKTSFGLLAAAGAALVAGTAFGLLASQDASALQSGQGRLRVSEGQALKDSADAKGGAANLLWIGGGAGAVAGGILFALTLPEPGDAP